MKKSRVVTKSVRSVTRTVVLLGMVLVSALVFSCELILHRGSGQTSASSRFSPEFEKRFTYTEPDWDPSAWYAQREKGSYKLSSSRDQYFSLQSRFFNKYDNDGEGGGDITGVSAPSVQQVFASGSMNEIAGGTPKVFVQSEIRNDKGIITQPEIDNAAFVMLDNDDGYDNRVVLEFLNLSSITYFEASYNGTKFGRINNWADRDNPSLLGTAGAFVSVEGNADLKNPSFLKYYNKDLTNPNRPDKIFWGKKESTGEFQVRGMFNREGYYQFRFDVTVWGTSAARQVTLQFGFYIGHAKNYVNTGAAPKNMPVFDLNLDPLDTVHGQGRPVMPGLMRPSHSTAKDKNGNYIPTNNDRFFYNYQDDFPSIQYNNDRYSVSVVATDHNKVKTAVASDKSNGDFPKFTFDKLGVYQVDAEMLFTLNISGVKRIVHIPNFAVHRYYLDIFGFEAQYWDFETKSYKWFGGEDTRTSPSTKVNSDITNFKDVAGDFIFKDNEGGANNGADFEIDKTNENSKRTSADNAIRNLAGKLEGINPVVTNSPPVSLRYNVSHAYADTSNMQILTRVAYRKNSFANWSYNTPYGNDLFAEYTVGRPFEAAGDYAIIVYYEYNAAETNETVGKLHKQIFYFRVTDFASEVMFKVGTDEYRSFADLMGQKIYTSALGVVYRNPADELYYKNVGPFEVKPRLELLYTNFAGTEVREIKDFKPESIPQSALEWYGTDGYYTFRIYYGNNSLVTHMPYMDFTAILDSSPIQKFQCYQGNNPEKTGLEVRNGTGGAPVSNISIFGGGEVTLSWDRKESGADMLMAKLDYYEFRSGDGVYLETVNETRLTSQFKVSQKIPRNLRILPTENGFMLGDKLTAPGLYVITITDTAGKDSQYIIIIDTTAASIAQNPAVVKDKVNIQNAPTTVGFGREKLIADKGGYLAEFFTRLQMEDLTFYNALLNSGYFVNGTDVGIKIPVNKVEMSVNNVDFFDTYIRPNSTTPLAIGPNSGTANSILGYVPTSNPLARAIYGGDIPGNIISVPIYNWYNRPLAVNPNDPLTVFFRLTDLTGNTATHYVELNSDRTLSIIFEDSIPTIIQEDGDVSPTATIIQSDMISSRDYITFSFMQALRDNPWRVSKVNVAYYPLTFQPVYSKLRVDAQGNPVLESGQFIYDTVTNKNYPFLDTPEVFTVYNVEPAEATDEKRIPININRAPLTRQGLYVITRICDNGDMRNYHFIVDNNAVISNKNFETGIRVEFGTSGSAATYNDFQRINNSRMNPDRDRVLRTNETAYVKLPGTIDGSTGTKYGRVYTDSGTGLERGDLAKTFTILKGDLLHPNDTGIVTFNSLDITCKVEYRAPGSDEFVPHDSLRLEKSGLYRVALTDRSGGYSWILGADAPKPLDGNRSEILIEIIKQGPQGTFSLNGRQIAASTTDASGNIHSVHIGNKATDRLTFSYVVKDTSNFLQEVSAPPTRVALRQGNSSPIPLVVVDYNPSGNQEDLLSGSAVSSVYTVGTVTFCEITLPLPTQLIKDGDTFLITLNNSRTFEVTLDNTPPNSNLSRIIKEDMFFNGKNLESINLNAGGNAINLDGSSVPGTDGPLKYPFRISNSFSFNRATLGVFSFDTDSISYFEVDSRLSNISGEHFFKYNQGYFSDIVGMGVEQSDVGSTEAKQNRFFRIVERDEAGNRTEYFVQLRSDDYVDNIEVTDVFVYNSQGHPTGSKSSGNLISEILKLDGKYEPVRGYEISVQNVRTFFANNLFFELTAGDLSIKRLGLKTMINTSGAEMVATPENFAAELQKMLKAGHGSNEEGGSIEFTLNNRFKNFSWEVRQITRNTEKVEIESQVVNPYLSDIIFKVKEGPNYPSGLAGSKNFIFEVYDLSNINAGPITKHTKDWTSSIDIDYRYSEYLVVVTDEFGRVVKHAYNGMYGNNIELKYKDGMFDYVGDDLYVGSGVDVVYAANAYDLEIYRDDVLVYRNGKLLDEELSAYVVLAPLFNPLDNTKITLMPEEDKIVEWRVAAYRRGTGAMWERKVFLYGELPPLQFTNQSGQAVGKSGENESISGIVTVSYSLEGLLFNSSIEYWRTWPDANDNQRTDYFPISENMTRFNLAHKGTYVFIVTNALGFRSRTDRYKFTIDDVSNRHYKVSFSYNGEPDGQGNMVYKDYGELEASPYGYNFSRNNDGDYTSIPHFFVRDTSNTMNTSVLRNCVDDRYDAAFPLRIVPTTNSNFKIIGDLNTPKRFFRMDGTNTFIYRLLSPTTQAEIFLAITLVEGYIANDVVLDFEYMSFRTLTSTNVLRVLQQTPYKPLDEITVKLNRGSLYDEDNVLYVDYFRSGSTKPLGRLQGEQKLTILARDYGVYTFRVSDHAGNVRTFTDASLGSADYYTLINLARAPLYISDTSSQESAPIIEGMVYSDSVSLKVIDLPYISSGTNTAYATKLEVYLNKVLRYDLSSDGEAANKDQERKSYDLSEPGDYKVKMTYKIPEAGTSSYITIVCEYNFTIVSSTQKRQSFSFVAPEGTEISSVRFYGNEIRPRFAEEFLRQITLNSVAGGEEYGNIIVNNNSVTGNGEYEITLRMGTDNLHQYSRTKSFKVYIRGLGRANVFTTGVDYGKSTTGKVVISVIPATLISAYGECRVIVLRDNTIVRNEPYSSAGGSIAGSQQEEQLAEVTDTGNYRIFVASLDSIITEKDVVGTVYFAQTFQITKAENPLGTIITIAAIVLVVITVLIFIRLRTKMRVR